MRKSCSSFYFPIFFLFIWRSFGHLVLSWCFVFCVYQRLTPTFCALSIAISRRLLFCCLFCSFSPFAHPYLTLPYLTLPCFIGFDYVCRPRLMNCDIQLRSLTLRIRTSMWSGGAAGMSGISCTGRIDGRTEPTLALTRRAMAVAAAAAVKAKEQAEAQAQSHVAISTTLLSRRGSASGFGSMPVSASMAVGAGAATSDPLITTVSKKTGMISPGRSPSRAHSPKCRVPVPC
jgi:hypothetical protein